MEEGDNGPRGSRLRPSNIENLTNYAKGWLNKYDKILLDHLLDASMRDSSKIINRSTWTIVSKYVEHELSTNQ